MGIRLIGVFDKFGIFTSAICAVHCAICALVPSLLASLGIAALGHSAEWFFVVLAVTTSITAWWVGFRRRRNNKITVLLWSGVAVLVTSRLVEELAHGAHHHEESAGAEHLVSLAEIIPVAMGAIAAGLLVAGHLYNLRDARCPACTERPA